jgi:hypothetical protein
MINAIKNHSNFSADDYEYLSNKGYSDEEIVSIWTNDRYSEPQGTANIPDCVGVASGHRN